MVGRLVEKQDIRLGNQRHGYGRAFELPARHCRSRYSLVGNAQLREHPAKVVAQRHMLLRHPGKESLGILDASIENRHRGVEIGILFKKSHPYAAAQGNLSRIVIFLSGKNTQERRLAGSVLSNNTNLVAFVDA